MLQHLSPDIRIGRYRMYLCASLAVGLLISLVACAPAVSPEPVEVTRIVEQEVEVTRVVEQVVETVVTATPEPAMAPAEPADPSEDRVGYPENYRDEFTVFYEFDRPDNKTARVIWANDAAASITQEAYQAVPVAPDAPFPYGSVLVMEVFRTERDEDGNVVLDENDRYVRGDLFGTFIMRKEPGFGAKYGHQRNGEWEYMAYRPDGSQLLPPDSTQACAACHVEASQGRDWVFGVHRAFGEEAAYPLAEGENAINILDYGFRPATLEVQAGTEVTWHNNDVLIHTVTADDGSFNSGALRPGASFTHTFEEPGTYEYFCAIHPAMTGTIVVTE